MPSSSPTTKPETSSLTSNRGKKGQVPAGSAGSEEQRKRVFVVPNSGMMEAYGDRVLRKEPNAHATQAAGTRWPRNYDRGRGRLGARRPMGVWLGPGR